ncbi:drug/metabolite transporter (DMT)-like permease [Paucimonas lemoignei]|uniref:Drug/metabolite transporter (DMT)-like permease n=1 Tax=Paucimonas lemoignei TaxID=29443 RepID=A0A4R3HYQ0_PAULE|nr:DMT family transporter [Paucimonas lemoignei]TCS37994.1 drug/metabolite transporter (DMT)-like permease [Paucimonas lemoignei]
MSEAIAHAAAGHRGDPFVVELSLMLVTPALFAANMVAARWAESANIPPVFLAFGRWSLAFLFLLPSVAPSLWRWRHVLLAHWPQLLLLSALGMGVAVAPQYIGARHTSAANVALIFAACPVLVAIMEATIWKASLDRRQIGGMALAIAGVLAVLSKGDVVTLSELQFGQGDLWVILAASGWALYTILSRRRLLPPLPGTVRLAALAAGGAIVLAPFAVVETVSGAGPDLSDGRLYIALCFLAIVPSLGAYFFFDRLVALRGAASASIAMYMVPLHATLVAWPLLGEIPQLYHAVGLSFILGGVMLASRKRKHATYTRVAQA